MSALEKARRAALNLERAVRTLESFLAQSHGTELEQAGVIQAFEFTFEASWKAFQKMAEAQGLKAPSPKQALAAAFRLGVIDDEDLWLAMLDDRNQTSHTYNRAVAERIYAAVRGRYASLCASALLELKRQIDTSG